MNTTFPEDDCRVREDSGQGTLQILVEIADTYKIDYASHASCHISCLCIVVVIDMVVVLCFRRTDTVCPYER